MTNDYKVIDEKLRQDINREAIKISVLSSEEVDKCEFLTGDEILRSNQRQIIEQVKFAYSPLEKSFRKTNRKTGWCFKVSNPSNKKGELKQFEATFPQNLINDLIRAKLKQSLIYKILSKEMSHNINTNVEKFIILVNILCLLFFKKYT